MLLKFPNSGAHVNVRRFMSGLLHEEQQDSSNLVVSDLWHNMRKPFTVPPEHHAVHVYEIFDDNMAGCLTCGHVHICNNCADVIETEEGCVCSITGLVVYPFVFKSTEFMDTCILTKRCRRQSCIEQTQQHVQVCQNIQQHIDFLFTSKEACSVLQKEQANSLQLLVDSVMHALPHQSHQPPCNIIALICQSIQPSVVFKYKTYANNVLDFITHVFDVHHRKDVLERVCVVLEKFLTPLHSSEILRIRPSEVSSLMIGLLYLLRNGVQIHDLVILPQIPELKLILPNTMHLERVFKIRAKTLTEVENRVKFTLRQMDCSSMKKMWGL